MHYLPVLLVLCLTPVLSHAQNVYKWVDAEGKTHYGSQPPPSAKSSEALKLSGASTGTEGRSRTRAVEYNADGTRKIPKDVQELAQGMEEALKKRDGNEVPLNCVAAVKNIQDQSDVMLEMGAKNVRGGYITKADFEAQAAGLRKAKSETNVARCNSSTGRDRALYQCMSNGNNHLLSCSQ